MKLKILSTALVAAFVAVLGAQETPVDSTRPRFTQRSTNVFRRFAVDLAKMKEFYGDVLGLGALPAISLGAGQMTRFHAGTTEVKLQPSAAETQAPSGAIRDVIGLRVLTFFFPDEAALTARFKEHGLPAPQFRKASNSAGSSALVTDPSGQWVEIVVVPGAPADTFEKIEIGLTVSDVEKSRTFYRDFVGLEELKPVVDAQLGTTKYPFRLGTTTINVWSFGKTAPVNTSSAGIQYVVVNVDEVDARAKAQHIKIDRPLSNFSAALRTVWLGDPDGITNYFAQVQGRQEISTR
jgi:catechol-2,3-dioxygenase